MPVDTPDIAKKDAENVAMCPTGRRCKLQDRDGDKKGGTEDEIKKGRSRGSG